MMAGSGREDGVAQDGSENAPDPQQRDEEALDRELDELTSELRMVIPGVTVLLAFLLSVPFASGFPSLGGLQQGAYFTAFLSTALAVVFLLGEGPITGSVASRMTRDCC